ncbi:MAG: NAD(P)-dependent oxidoreductase [Deltaproteobacteria bacterium]|nr:NAD(P)-dependent oxidoreductase [Deltaproteobacteria bacterium]
MEKIKRIGWIGIGKMGLPMASHILKEGFELSVFDIDPRPCEVMRQRGAKIANSINSLSNGCQVIVSILPNDHTVETVAGQLLAQIGKDVIFLEMSTISPKSSSRVAEMADMYSVSYLRAPVSGTVGNAEARSLTAMVSGPREAYDRCQSLFGAFCKKHFYLGSEEEARWMKLVVNLQVGALAAALGEGLTMGRAGGLDWEIMLEVLEQSVVSSPLLKVKLPFLLRRDFTPAFTAKQMSKDFDLILDAMSETCSVGAMACWIRQLLTAMQACGLGENDYFGCVEIYENLAGLKKS